jgi:hypothetical protein
MTPVHVKGIKRFRDRHGKWRCYHRKTGAPIHEEFGSPAFFVRLAELDRQAEAKEKATPGTLRALIKAYRESLQFKELAPRTQQDYQKVFRLPRADRRRVAVPVRPAERGQDPRQGRHQARPAVRKLRPPSAAAAVLVGARARMDAR